jgi:hypothetical protein
VTRAAETFTIPAANLPWPTETYGPELVTNGTFDSDTSGWTAGATTTLTRNASSQLEITSADGDVGQAIQQITGLESGKNYVLSFDVVSTNLIAHVRAGFAANDSSTSTPQNIIASGEAVSGQNVVTFTAGASGDYLYIGGRGDVNSLVVENISVRELTRYPVSIQMNGRMTYADTGDVITSTPTTGTVNFYNWPEDVNNYIAAILRTEGADVGSVRFTQEIDSTYDAVGSSAYTPGILVPFNIASRHGMTFLNGAVDGVALTANTTPTNLPDLSNADLDLAYNYMGTVERFRVWGVDLGDTGLEAATAPSLEPSLSLTFDSSESSFVVDDWSA